MQFPDISPYVPLLGPYSFALGAWHVGPIGVRWYALAYIAGILLGWRYCVGLVRNPRLWGAGAPTATPLQLDDLILWVTLGVVVGGRVGSVLFYNTAMIWKDPLGAFRIWDGGMSFHGGMIGVAVALLLFARRHRIDLLRLCDLVAPCVPFGLFFGRIANFINGELWGRVSEVPWAMVFPTGGPEPRHPSQLYEAGLEGIVLFVIVNGLCHGTRIRERPGALGGVFLIGYGCTRSIVEFFRQPDAFLNYIAFGWLTMGQLLSLPLLIAGLYLLVSSGRRAKLPDAQPG